MTDDFAPDGQLAKAIKVLITIASRLQAELTLFLIEAQLLQRQATGLGKHRHQLHQCQWGDWTGGATQRSTGVPAGDEMVLG